MVALQKEKFFLETFIL